jgi:UDP-N-acetylmuramate dehydrogenase
MIIQENVDLRPYNTFNISVLARYFIVVRSIDEIQQVITSKIFRSSPHLILGGGSNLLFTKDFDGVVIKVELNGIKVVSENDETVTLYAGAGQNWHSFVLHCVDHDFGGIENLSLIPGTTGAAPMQNIGAYGAEIKDVILNVEAIDKSNGTHHVFINEQCQFGYRESIFKQHAKDKYFITGIHAVLTKRNHKLNINYGAIKDTLKIMGVSTPTLKNISDAVIQIRRTKLPDPTYVGNAGSFFKNPSVAGNMFDHLRQSYPSIPSYPSVDGLVKIPAAWLIEQCGWKGKTFDKIGVHPHQALVLVNYGGGDGEKIWELAMQVRDSVKNTFNITLQPEVNVIA